MQKVFLTPDGHWLVVLTIDYEYPKFKNRTAYFIPGHIFEKHLLRAGYIDLGPL